MLFFELMDNNNLLPVGTTINLLVVSTHSP